MKAAIAATQYRLFDTVDGSSADGRLDRVSIAKVFAVVQGVSPRQAWQMGDYILSSGDAQRRAHRAPLPVRSQCAVHR